MDKNKYRNEEAAIKAAILIENMLRYMNKVLTEGATIKDADGKLKPNPSLYYISSNILRLQDACRKVGIEFRLSDLQFGPQMLLVNQEKSVQLVDKL